MIKQTLWVFGDSFSYPYKVKKELSWPELLSKRLNSEIKNYAQPGADNFFIF